jgi:hypothetical protein
MVITKWQYRADTAANWIASAPTLAAGEIGVEKDTQGIKVGDGVTAWAALPYLFPVGGTVAAIGALFKYRVADAGNSSVAAIGNLGVFTGAWMRTDGYARVDIALTLAAAGTLAVQHSDDGVNPIAALTETWTAAAAAHPIFPTELRRTWYRVVLTDTGGGGAVTLAATLDPRSLEPLAPLSQVTISGLAHTATSTNLAPLGARRFQWQTRQTVLTREAGSDLRCYVDNASPLGFANTRRPEYGTDTPPLLPGQTVYFFNNTSVAADIQLWFYSR